MAGYILNNIPSDSNVKIQFDSSKINIRPVTTSTTANNHNNTDRKIVSKYQSMVNMPSPSLSVGIQQDLYSNNGLSSRSNIFINKIANDITNVLKNSLTSEEFSFYKNYLIGKKVTEIIKSDGTIKEIDVNDQFIDENIITSINTKIRKMPKDQFGVIYDRQLLECTFKEIVNNKSGFDAIVLENDNEYFIVSACCDINSKEDVMAISYALLYQITGSDELHASLSSLLINDKGKIADYDVKELVNGEKYYRRQRADNIKLIEKYTNKGKKLRLEGYSLGGGIMIDSFARLYYEYPEKYEDVTLTLFNPFMAYLEIDSKQYDSDNDKYNFWELNNIEKNLTTLSINKNFNSLIDSIKKYGNGVLIYSTEGDTVSQFNNLTKVFKNQMVYIKGNKNIESDLINLTDIINLTIGENSRHSFTGIDLNCFDKKGYLIVQGNQITVNEIAGGQASTNNQGIIIETIINKHLQQSVGNYLNSMPKDQEWMKNDLINMYFDFRRYLINNAGNYTTDSMIECIVPSLTNLLKDGAVNTDSSAWIPNMLIDNNQIETSLKEYIKTENGKHKLQDILDDFLRGNINSGVNKLQDFMAKIYYKTDTMKTITEIQKWAEQIKKEYETGYDLGLQLYNQVVDESWQDSSKKTL